MCGQVLLLVCLVYMCVSVCMCVFECCIKLLGVGKVHSVVVCVYVSHTHTDTHTQTHTHRHTHTHTHTHTTTTTCSNTHTHTHIHHHHHHHHQQQLTSISRLHAKLLNSSLRYRRSESLHAASANFLLQNVMDRRERWLYVRQLCHHG